MMALMSSRDRSYWMWAEACALIERAESLHRQFFQPNMQPLHRPHWEPPVDLFETEQALVLIVALPGAVAEQIELSQDSSGLLVVAARSLPREVRGAAIHRMEIPAGRFERRVELPPGRFELVERRFVDGCLTLAFRKLAGSAGASRGTT